MRERRQAGAVVRLRQGHQLVSHMGALGVGVAVDGALLQGWDGLYRAAEWQTSRLVDWICEPNQIAWIVEVAIDGPSCNKGVGFTAQWVQHNGLVHWMSGAGALPARGAFTAPRR